MMLISAVVLTHCIWWDSLTAECIMWDEIELPYSEKIEELGTLELRRIEENIQEPHNFERTEDCFVPEE